MSVAGGILDDEFALAYFYIVSPIPGVFAFSIERKSNLIKFLDDGCDSLNINLQVDAIAGSRASESTLRKKRTIRNE